MLKGPIVLFVLVATYGCGRTATEAPAADTEASMVTKQESPASAETVLVVPQVSQVSIERKGSDPFLGEYAYLHFSVSNPYDTAIARLKLRARTTSKGRSVPWGTAELVEDVSGGIEPGEERSFKVRWGTRVSIGPGKLLTSDMPADARLELEVIGASGPNGEALLGSTAHTLERPGLAGPSTCRR